MFREGYASKILADVMKIIAEEKRESTNQESKMDNGEPELNDENKKEGD